MTRDPPATLDEPDSDLEVIQKLRAEIEQLRAALARLTADNERTRALVQDLSVTRDTAVNMKLERDAEIERLRIIAAPEPAPYYEGWHDGFESRDSEIGELRAEVERLKAEVTETRETCSELRLFDLAEIERLRAASQRALDHYDMRSELYTNDADVAAGMVDILSAILEPKPQWTAEDRERERHLIEEAAAQPGSYHLHEITKLEAEVERLRAEAADRTKKVESLWALSDARGAEIERLSEAHEWIVRLSHAYPLTIFPEPDLKKARELLEAGGMTLDAISADAMRHVITQVAKISSAALEAKP
jgi:DNA repair exonuclease SbcCD ATPase subunit